MIHRLKNISTITTGIYSKTTSTSNVYYIQARDFDSNYNLLDNLEPSVILSPNIEKHLLAKGDVIFASKGFDRFAFVFNNEVTPAVPSSIFMTIRKLNTNIISSDFLAWYLNHPNTQLYFARIAKGSVIPSINKKMIGDLEIEIPSINKQKQILRIDLLRKKEIEITNQILKLKSILLNQKLLNVLN